MRITVDVVFIMASLRGGLSVVPLRSSRHSWLRTLRDAPPPMPAGPQGPATPIPHAPPATSPKMPQQTETLLIKKQRFAFGLTALAFVVEARCRSEPQDIVALLAASILISIIDYGWLYEMY